MTQGRHDVRYRGLDGIKGLALVAVVLYHTVGTALPGGYVGVDMFLTVSGFLAGTGLLGVLRRERRLRPLSYWRRRLARIAPPLALVVMASAVLARVLQPDLLVNTRRQALSALTFWFNWNAIASGASYFDSMNPQLFQHLWYVSVQMQLYLVAPLLLCALTRRFGRRRVVGSLTCLAAVSALAMAALYSPANPTRVYEGTDTHAVGFLLGMALATVVTGPSDLREPVLRHAPVAGGAAFAILVLLARFLGQGPLAFRGGIFLAAVCSMALVAGAVGGCPWLVRLLETRPLALLGRQSYAVYLCHWPVWLLVSPLLRGLPDVVSLALALALTAASSVGCERLVGLVAQGAREVRAGRKREAAGRRGARPPAPPPPERGAPGAGASETGAPGAGAASHARPPLACRHVRPRACLPRRLRHGARQDLAAGAARGAPAAAGGAAGGGGAPEGLREHASGGPEHGRRGRLRHALLARRPQRDVPRHHG